MRSGVLGQAAASETCSSLDVSQGLIVRCSNNVSPQHRPSKNIPLRCMDLWHIDVLWFISMAKSPSYNFQAMSNSSAVLCLPILKMLSKWPEEYLGVGVRREPSTPSEQAKTSA